MAKLICLMQTYNKEDTLARAIESVVMQKTDFDYKLIILDDCSTDNSNKIANEYREKYPNKIEVVRYEKNLKILRSIIRGYKYLKGAEYFCVLDADDWYTYDKKFQDAVDFLDKNKNYSMYMTNILVRTDDEEYLWYKGEKEFLDFDFQDRKNGKHFFVQTSGVVYRNLYFKNGENKKFDNVLNLHYPEAYMADGFRYEWYLKGGRARFVNHLESVYDFTQGGFWSGRTVGERDLWNTILFFGCAEFIEDEEDFYIKEAKTFFNRGLQNLKNDSDEIFLRNKKIIIEYSDYIHRFIKPKLTKTKKFFINLIPNKTLRTKIKNNYRV